MGPEMAVLGGSQNTTIYYNRYTYRSNPYRPVTCRHGYALQLPSIHVENRVVKVVAHLNHDFALNSKPAP